MSELETLQRFRAEVGPPEPHAIDAARRRLQAAIDERSQGAPARTAEIYAGRVHRTRARRPRALALAVGATAAAAALAVGLAGSLGPIRATAPHQRHRVLVLADYRFHLPGGFAPKSSSCLPASTTPHNAMTVMQGFKAAASADGGCLEASLVAGDVVPSGALPVAVGSYQGDIVDGPDGGLTLYVAIPAAVGSRYLVLTATGLSQAQLIAIASSAFPG